MLSYLFVLAIAAVCLSGCIETGHKENGNSGVAVSYGGNVSYMGRTELKDSSYKNLTVKGRFKAENVTVENKAKIIGKASIEKSKFKTLNIIGKADLEEVDVTDQLKVVGVAELEDGKYGQIILCGEEFEFSDIKADSITVIEVKDSGKKQEQVLELKDCTIQGDIIFEGGMGKVEKYGNTKILGKVKGLKKN